MPRHFELTAGRYAIFAVQRMNKTHGLYALRHLLLHQHGTMLRCNKKKICGKCLLGLLNWR